MNPRLNEESALREINDRLEITAVARAYAYAADTMSRGDVEEGRRIIKTCFTEDVLVEGFAVDHDRSAPPTYSFHGIDSWIDAVMKTFVALGYKATQHHMGNLLIHVSGDTATMESCVTAPHAVDCSRAMDLITATYTDRLVRAPDGWRIAHRKARATSFLRLESPAAGAMSDAVASAEGWRKKSDAGAAGGPQHDVRAAPRRPIVDERSLSDRLEIEAVAVSYGCAADAVTRGDLEEARRIIMQCFTEETLFESYIPTSDPSGPPDYRLIGPEPWIAAGRSLGYTASQHQIGNVDIHVQGDTASMKCCLSATLVRSWSSSLDFVTGTYTDRLVRTPNGWRIAHRKLATTNFVRLESPPSGTFEQQFDAVVTTLSNAARRAPAHQTPRVAGAELSERSLADSIRAFRARTEIGGLALLYAHAADAIGRGDVEEGRAHIRAAFAPDVVYEAFLWSDDPNAPPFFTANSPDSFVDQVHAGFVGLGYVATQHHMGNIEVHLEGEKATMRCCVMAIHILDPGSRIMYATCTYEDDVARTADGWRITRRRLRGTSGLRLQSPPRSAVEAPTDAVAKAFSQ